MWFIGYDQMLIAVDDVDIKRNSCLVRYRTVIPNKFVVACRSVVAYWASVVADNFAVFNSAGYCLQSYVWEPLEQVLDNCGVGTGRNTKPGWSDAVAHGQRGCSHKASLGAETQRIGCCVEASFDKMRGKLGTTYRFT